MARKKKIPQFDSEDAERDFWSEQDSTEYVEWSDGKIGIFPELKPSPAATNIFLAP